MDESRRPQIVCAKEALDLLNCVTSPSFDQDKCLSLLNTLRSCVLEKKVKKFTLAETNHPEPDSSTEKQQ